jgi:hypothetical protein
MLTSKEITQIEEEKTNAKERERDSFGSVLYLKKEAYYLIYMILQ